MDAHYLPMPLPDAALAALPAPVADWFARTFGAPTLVQTLAWPAVARGVNVLISAPTGTGKTLAAFLPLLGDLLNPAAAGVRCLYVAPLKALAADALRNLEAHLAGIVPARVPTLGLRTGDTTPSERRRLRLDPPDVLLTTPESLAVLLSQPEWHRHFAGLRGVVIDEVHALAGTKRGADLALSLERVRALATGSVQRIGLSATAAPLAVAARYLVGSQRPCAIAVVADETDLRLTVEPLPGEEWFLRELVARLTPELEANRSTLVFTNTRGLAERLAWALRHHRPEWDDRVAVHHSSLAADRRREVEERFKRGELLAVVTSTSLELGIDVGPVDGVVLVHPPGDVVRLLQRVGRAGHAPGRPRRGLILTATSAELLEAAVTAASGLASQCEPLRIPDAPLDVLCQHLLGLASGGPFDGDEAFALVRRAASYEHLARSDFDACLAYLCGEDRDGRPWLPARLARAASLTSCPLVGEALSTPSPLVGEGRGYKAAPPTPALPRGGGREKERGGGRFAIVSSRVTRLLRQNVGTILADEPRPVVVRDPSGDDLDAAPPRVIGQVDDAFVQRLEPGDRFLLDGRVLEFRRTSGPDVLVDEVVGRRPAVPRWAGEGWPLSPELARRLYLLRLQAAEALREGPDPLGDLLRRQYGLDGRAVEILSAYFAGQECVSEIPDTNCCLIEAVVNDSGVDYHVHTPLNRRANDALARVAVLRLARDHGRSAASVVADLGFALCLRGGLDPFADLLRRLLDPEGFDRDLGEALSSSPAVRERFQRVAFTGLMLLRNPLGQRRRVGGRDWGERNLFDRVQAHDPDFVLLRQAEREVRADLCDADAARDFATGLRLLAVRCRRLSRPSPFAEHWTQRIPGPAEVIDTPAEALQRLHAALMGGVVDARPG